MKLRRTLVDVAPGTAEVVFIPPTVGGAGVRSVPQTTDSALS
jgi:imidazole glycerol phosphate synthase subunit HisF